MINLLIISLLIIIFIDKSDIVNTLKKVFEFILSLVSPKLVNIWTIAGRPFKPFSCPFCLICWATIFYCLFIQQSIYLLLYGIGLAYLSDVISELLDVIKGAIQKIITNIEEKIC